ncbi:MAG: phage terminase large subunit family protein [Deltaproteobacteria bacterium]|nr:phage terminase large subunit family protein [Deltaproteobacteria bacterium]
MGGIEFSLKGCEYMAEIMRDSARHMAVIKGTQARITTAFMLREIHALIHRQRPQGSLYYFPTERDVERFSKTRQGPLIADNPIIKRHLRSTNSVSVKKVDKSFLCLLGGKATSVIQGKKDSGAVRTTSGDCVIRDERDLFDDYMADMINDRLLNSTLKLEVDLGSPTIPDMGIDRVFGKSDQKYRMIKCSACNTYTSIALDFPNSIKYKKSGSGRSIPYYACIKCGKEISPCNGEYVAKFPSKYNPKYPNEGISGYHVSHFITPNCNLGLVMSEWEEAQIDSSKLGRFYNTYLGFAYIPVEDRLRIQEVYDCCGNDVMKTMSTKETAMGADIMKTNRVVIAEKTGKDKAKIINMTRVSGFDALYDMVKRFNVKSAVICIRPYEESFRKFQAKCADINVTVYGSQYPGRDNANAFMKVDEKSGVYTVNRTEAMDKSQAWIRSGKLEIPRMCDEVKVFAKECCNTAKVLETNEDTGDRTYRYRPIGDKQEHYRHCINYLQLAIGVLTHNQGMSAVGYNHGESSYDPLEWDL